MQKGLDLIADVFPSVLERHPNAQLICIGPVIDLYGRFAALKLQKLMEIYPDRVCSKPEFTVLPPFIFSGAEFALIPSRDEPFGLVAVEFGRKGALGVGSRVGGLGQMPGWWFTVESVATKHLVRQFKLAIRNALSSSQETRALMRARSSIQRFPVAQWVEDLEKLQDGSISAHQKVSGKRSSVSRLNSAASSIFSSPVTSAPNTAPNTAPSTRPASRTASRAASRASSPTRLGSDSLDVESVLKRAAESLKPERSRLQKRPTTSSLDRVTVSPPSAVDSVDFGNRLFPIRSRDDRQDDEGFSKITEMPVAAPRAILTQGGSRGVRSPTPSVLWTPPSSEPGTPQGMSRTPSMLSLETVVGDEKNYHLQKVDPSFTDAQGLYFKEFERRLSKLSSQTSEGAFCIEDYIRRSEKDWFNRFHKAKLGSAPSAPSVHSTREISTETTEKGTSELPPPPAEFELGHGYAPPTGARKFLQYKIRDWPIYSFLIALVSSLKPSPGLFNCLLDPGPNTSCQLVSNHLDSRRSGPNSREALCDCVHILGKYYPVVVSIPESEIRLRDLSTFRLLRCLFLRPGHVSLRKLRIHPRLDSKHCHRAICGCVWQRFAILRPQFRQ